MPKRRLSKASARMKARGNPYNPKTLGRLYWRATSGCGSSLRACRCAPGWRVAWLGWPAMSQGWLSGDFVGMRAHIWPLLSN